MNSTTKTIVITTSIVAIGGVALLLMSSARKRRREFEALRNQVPQGTNDGKVVYIDTSYKGKDITQGGKVLPSKEEWEKWKIANPLKLELPTLKQMLAKPSTLLGLGEQVPSNANYGINQYKLSDWKKQFGV